MVETDPEELLRAQYHAQTARIPWHELQIHYAGGSVRIFLTWPAVIDVAGDEPLANG